MSETSCITMFRTGWVVGLRLIVRMRDLGLGGKCPPRGVFLRDPSPYLREFRRKSRKTPKKLDRQVRPGIAPALKVEPLGHWWG